MINDLYRETILGHSRRPRNFRLLEDANGKAEGYHPLRGDRRKVFLKEHHVTEVVKDKTVGEAETLLAKFHELLATDQPLPKDLGKLVVFSGVRGFPAFVKYGTLAWHSLRAALRGAGEAVSSE